MTALLERKLAELHGASSEGEAVAAAIRDRDLVEVRRLLDESPHLVRAGDARSNQPIHWAVMTRQIPLIDELLSRGAEIDARRADGARPIQLTNGDYHYRGWRDVPDDVITTPDEVYRHLVARGARVPIGMAAFKGDLARVRALLDEDPSLANRVDEYNAGYAGCGAPLKNAAIGGHLEIVKLLLERGADPNQPEEGIAPHGHALYSAVYHGHYEIAQLLLEHGAYPNPPVESFAEAVWIAIRRGDIRMLELLASHGAVWEIPIALDGTLTYERIVATGMQRVARRPRALRRHGLSGAAPRCQPCPRRRSRRPISSRGSRGVRPPPASLSTRPCEESHNREPTRDGGAAFSARHGSEPAELAAHHAAAPVRGQRSGRARSALSRSRR